MNPKIGAHVSTAGGLHTAIERIKDIGGDCLQIFGASPRQWAARLPDEDKIKKFKEAVKESGIGPIYLHAAYLPNLASPVDETVEKSITNLSIHLQIAELIGANGLIFHIGSGKELPKEKAMAKVVKACKAILKKVPGKAELVMENSAGGGQKLGSSVAEIGVMIKKIDSNRMKVCWDTAHAFEAGVMDEHSPANIKKLFNEFDKEIGLDKLVALHVNDSKTPFNSHHDRHENIGEGHIGLSGFKNLAKEKRLGHTAWFLEVPGFDGMGPDKKNIDILKALF
jgi:deoxyribonuclease-4